MSRARFGYDAIDLVPMHLTTWLCFLWWTRKAFTPQHHLEMLPFSAITYSTISKGQGEESEEWAVKLGKWPPSPHAAKEKAFGLTCKVFRKKRIHSFPVCSSWKIYALNPVVRGSGFGEWLIGSKPHLVAQTENTPRRCPWRITRGREGSKDSFNTGKGNWKQKLSMLKAFLYPL